MFRLNKCSLYEFTFLCRTTFKYDYVDENFFAMNSFQESKDYQTIQSADAVHLTNSKLHIISN